MTTQKTETIVRSARRFTDGLALLSNPNYKFVPFESSPNSFFVFKSGECAYIVLMETRNCSCEDFKKHGDFCKHLFAVEELMEQEAQCAAYDPNEESGRDEYPL